METLIKQLLIELGENPERDGLKDTPGRVDKSLRFLTKGYHQDLKEVFNDAFFPIASEEMVIVKEIEFYSLCEHHMLPFFGVCHVAYLPNKKVVGISKLPRVVEYYSRRLQIQEQLTSQIAEAVRDHVHPHGVGVVIEAQHFCMMMRGVEKQRSKTVTSAMLGVFKSDPKTRSEFLELLRHDSRY